MWHVSTCDNASTTLDMAGHWPLPPRIATWLPPGWQHCRHICHRVSSATAFYWEQWRHSGKQNRWETKELAIYFNPKYFAITFQVVDNYLPEQGIHLILSIASARYLLSILMCQSVQPSKSQIQSIKVWFATPSEFRWIQDWPLPIFFDLSARDPDKRHSTPWICGSEGAFDIWCFTPIIDFPGQVKQYWEQFMRWQINVKSTQYSHNLGRDQNPAHCKYSSSGGQDVLQTPKLQTCFLNQYWPWRLWQVVTCCFRSSITHKFTRNFIYLSPVQANDFIELHKFIIIIMTQCTDQHILWFLECWQMGWNQ